jgi:hypothetical protein
LRELFPGDRAPAGGRENKITAGMSCPPPRREHWFIRSLMVLPQAAR